MTDLKGYFGRRREQHAPPPIVLDVPFGDDVGTEEWVDALLAAQVEEACEAADYRDPDDEDEPEEEAELPWWVGEYETDPGTLDENEDEEDPSDEEYDDAKYE